MSEATELRLSIDKLSRLMGKQMRQREQALCHWRDANPQLVGRCGNAARVLDTAFNAMLEEVLELTESPEESLNQFTMHEFIERFGPRLVHFQNLIQLLMQLGG